VDHTIAKTMEKAQYVAAIAKKETADAAHTIWHYLARGAAIARAVLFSKPGLTALAMAAAGATSGIYNLTMKVGEFLVVTAESLIFGAASSTVKFSAWAWNTQKTIVAKVLRLFKANALADKVQGFGTGWKDRILNGIAAADTATCNVTGFIFNAWRSKITRYPIMIASIITLLGTAANTITGGALAASLTGYGMLGLAALVGGGAPALMAFSGIVMVALGVGLTAATVLFSIGYLSVARKNPKAAGTPVQETLTDTTQEQLDMLRLTMQEYSKRVALLENAFNTSISSLSDALALKHRVNGSAS
jgi:cation transporter-like permease